ncbi:hypothetical protein K435DRAFT_806760 [Dendrothele bispora CBS 962.96]|uniref:Uncharacterized protein n=1 Tax=Dendrothele bispora (strain CBS 962.96) TaxID=1314807 RepID=A0A4S8L774_DENBC|nr:hypothetical protein K435DRAFT_806760 [Dendrothele bispora CBS 962.96]
MSARSFTVFCDAPSEDTTSTNKQQQPTAPPNTLLTLPPLKRSFSTPAVITSSGSLLSPPGDKENYNPLTGERAGAGHLASGKKRKTSVLVTKSLSDVKTAKGKEKDASDAQLPEAKKRKSSSSSSSSVSSSTRSKTKKDGTTTTTTTTTTKKKKSTVGSGTGKKPTRKSSRRKSPMPKVDEEELESSSERETQKMSQEQIDAKCYDYTVKPLADVSEAYGSAASLLSILDTPSDEETQVFAIHKEASAEPELRDYVDFSLSGSSSQRTLRASSSEPKSFSTPERKRIYAAFTFTSPSPSSDRFAKSKRSASVPILDLACSS